jgi:hypothetical protein
MTTPTLLIKPRSNSQFDVFFGKTGWDDWALFRRERNRLLLVKGSPVPNAVYTAISQQIIGK